jgi:hypothetical protein
MHECSVTSVPFVKGDKFGTFQSPRNQLEINQMKSIPYASAIGSIMYAQVYMRHDLAFVIELLGRFRSNIEMKHWKANKKALLYLHGTKQYMLMYKKTDNLEVIGYSDADFARCAGSQKSTSYYVFTLVNRAIS